MPSSLRTDRLRSSGMRSILIFFLPMTTLCWQANPLHCSARQPRAIRYLATAQ